MRQTTQQVRESILNIDDIKDQLNLLVHEIRSFSARIDEMQSSPLGLKYGFDCTYDYFFRMRDLKSKTKGIKTPNKPVILLVLMILECLKTGPRSERDIKDFVTEKCKKCGIKATNRGTIAGANLEISSACNILGAMGILEQAHVDDRVEPDLFINPALPDPPSDEGKIEDYLSLLAYRWSKIIESVVTESQTMEIASSASINQDKASVTANNTLIPPVKTEVQQHQSQTLPLPSTFNLSANPPNSKEMTPVPSQHSHDDMDFVDILMQSSEHLDLPSSHPDNYSHTLYPNHNQSLQTHLPLLNGESKEAMHPFAPTDYSMPLHPTNNNFILQHQTNPSEHDHSYRASDINLREGLNLPEYNDLNNATALMGQDLMKATTLPAGNKPSGMTRKSASSTKIWKIKRQLARNRLAPVSASTTTSTSSTSSGKDKSESNGAVNDDEVTRFLFTPDAFLEKWGENSFRHHASLEVEEKLLRRLASQCSLGFRSKEVTLTPSHVGTRYLDNHYDVSNSEVVPTISQVQPPPTTAPSSSSKGTKSGQRSKSSSSKQTQQPAASLGERDTAVDKTIAGAGTGASDFLDTSLLSISTHQSSDSLDALNDNASQSITNGGNTTSSSKNREYDFTANVTAQMLIDKVKKSKRHRGNSLANLVTYSSSNTSSTSSGVNQLTSVALNSLKNICQTSVQGYWGNDNQRKAASSSSSSLSTPVASNSSEMHSEEREEKDTKGGATSVAEYVRTCQQQNINITNQFLNSYLFHAQAQQLLVNGTSPNLSLNLFRHYVTPLSILDYDKIATTSPNTASVGGPIRYPDVMITTLEIPWKAIVSEFQVVRSEEMGLSLIDTSSTEVHRSYSYSDISPNHNQALPNNTQPSSSSKTSKQKSDRVHRSASFDSSSIQHLSNHHTAQPSATPVNSTILRCRSVSEVIAPAFREINHNSTNSQNDVLQHAIPSNDDVGIAIDRSMSISPAPPLPLRENDTPFKAEEQGDDIREDSDEDTSDEAYLSKHDHVLRTMREKWALMQQLKLETRREMMMQGQGPTSHHKRSYSFQSPFKAQKLPHSQSNEHLLAQSLSQSLSQQREEEEGEGGMNGVAMTEGGSDSVSPMAQSEGSPLDGTTSLLGGLISYNSRKRSYSLLNISKIGEVASQLVNGGTSSSATSSVVGVEGGSGTVPAVAVKKRGRPPKIQKTSHLHYGKINS